MSMKKHCGCLQCTLYTNLWHSVDPMFGDYTNITNTDIYEIARYRDHRYVGANEAPIMSLNMHNIFISEMYGIRDLVVRDSIEHTIWFLLRCDLIG